MISALFLLQLLVNTPDVPVKELGASTPPIENREAVILTEGLVLLQKHCYSCHNPKSKSHDEIIAPPLWGMKKHYLEAYPEKDSFEKAMVEFIQNPTEEKALMKGPIKRFGLMPKPAVSSEDLQKIVSYIYANELENPAWHIEKDNQEKNKSGGLR
jgi:mono/diheme cytochrome c family protein